MPLPHFVIATFLFFLGRGKRGERRRRVGVHCWLWESGGRFWKQWEMKQKSGQKTRAQKKEPRKINQSLFPNRFGKCVARQSSSFQQLPAAQEEEEEEEIALLLFLFSWRKCSDWPRHCDSRSQICDPAAKTYYTRREDYIQICQPSPFKTDYIFSTYCST